VGRSAIHLGASEGGEYRRAVDQAIVGKSARELQAIAL
jgi:hypothetical protein